MTATELTLAQQLRTYATQGTGVTVTVSSNEARKIACALDALEDRQADAIRIAGYNLDLFYDARSDRLFYWQMILLCAFSAAQLAELFEVFL